MMIYSDSILTSSNIKTTPQSLDDSSLPSKLCALSSIILWCWHNSVSYYREHMRALRLVESCAEKGYVTSNEEHDFKQVCECVCAHARVC